MRPQLPLPGPLSTWPLSNVLRLFAPFLPFTCEEVWSWWMQGSVHRANWPEAAELHAVAGDARRESLAIAAAVLGEIRGAKSAAKVSMRNPVTTVTVTDTAERLKMLDLVAGDVRDAGRIETLRDCRGSGLRGRDRAGSSRIGQLQVSRREDERGWGCPPDRSPPPRPVRCMPP